MYKTDAQLLYLEYLDSMTLAELKEEKDTLIDLVNVPVYSSYDDYIEATVIPPSYKEIIKRKKWLSDLEEIEKRIFRLENKDDNN